MARIGIKQYLIDNPKKPRGDVDGMSCIYRYSRPKGVTGKVYYLSDSNWVVIEWDDEEICYVHIDSVELVI